MANWNAPALKTVNNNSLLGSGNITTPQVIAQSGVASSITGTTSETTLATITIPAGVMGLNGAIRVSALFSCNASATNKVFRLKLGGAQAFIADTSSGATVVQHCWSNISIRNKGVANSQVCTPAYAPAGGTGSSTNAKTTLSIDTTAAQTLLITAQPANIGDTLVLESYVVEVIPS